MYILHRWKVSPFDFIITCHCYFVLKLNYEWSVCRLDACRKWRTKDGFVFPGVPSARNGNAHSRQIDPRRKESLKEVSVYMNFIACLSECRLFLNMSCLGYSDWLVSVILSVCLSVCLLGFVCLCTQKWQTCLCSVWCLLVQHELIRSVCDLKIDYSGWLCLPNIPVTCMWSAYM